MHLKNNFKISKALLSSIILLISLVSSASCKVFETVCNPNFVKAINGGEYVYISVTHAETEKLPNNFEIKIEFDNDVFKKNAKIDYSEEISKNYRHSKSILGNEISVKCSLKASKNVPDIPEGQELFLVTLETKKSIPKSETNFKIMAEGDFEGETQNVPIKIERTDDEKFSPILTKLIPNQGTLSPEFNPNINEYTLSVGYDIKDIEFDVDSVNSAGININRHKLNAPGSETDIFITVKGDKRGNKNIYHVAVSRDEKPENENTNLRRSSKNSILKQLMLGQKSSGNRNRKSQKDKKFDTDEDYDSEDDENGSGRSLFKEMSINRKENGNQDNEKLHSIIILSSILCLYVAYMLIKKKKHLKIKKLLNKIFKK